MFASRISIGVATVALGAVALGVGPSAAVTGNGAPSGAHYNLNIIGVDNTKPKNVNMGDDGGHRIFVDEYGITKIMLTNSGAAGEYEVLDANGTDGVAAFSLPNPDPTNDGITEYSVYARALGTPGGQSITKTCADTVGVDETVYCSTEQMVLTRGDGGVDKFTNVSKALLYIYANLDGVGGVERYPLFDSALEDYFWQYDNNGLKVAQLRFYEESTNVN